jgi:hypothetical protein
MEKKWGLIWPVLLLLILPLAVSWFVYPHSHVPPGFGVFPPGPKPVDTPPGFNLTVFIIVALLVLVVALVYLFPQWFGFKPASAERPPASNSTRLPPWFWVGLVLTLCFWWLMWERPAAFGVLVDYAFSPLWWGFILLLDGITYRRSGGYSLLASRTRSFVISAIVSLAGWCFFEYYNYFALGNWYYPNRDILPHGTVVVLFLIAYTTVWPAIFEWYTLLNTFPKLVARYANGPKLALSGKTLFWGGYALIVGMVLFPHPLFWAQWIGSMAVFSGLLIRMGISSPFSEMARGNWSPIALIALSSLLNGLFWEVWNWGSTNFVHNLPATNPNYWIYDIPYVNVIHIYAEMPLLGFAGYLPFGVMVWVVFIWAGKVFGFNSKLLKDE